MVTETAKGNNDPHRLARLHSQGQGLSGDCPATDSDTRFD
jgi:hypothetical protein